MRGGKVQEKKREFLTSCLDLPPTAALPLLALPLLALPLLALPLLALPLLALLLLALRRAC